MNGSAKKMLIVAVLIAAAGGAALMLERPAPATPAASGAPAVPARTKEQAMTALMALPELAAWSRQIEQGSGGTVRGALIEYDPAPKLIAGKPYWQLSFVENGSDAAQRWESFLVAQSGNEILVEDLAGDRQLTLAQWRQEQRPMERTSAR